MNTFCKTILGLLLLTTVYNYSFASEKPTLKNVQKKQLKKKTKRTKAKDFVQTVETLLELQEESEKWRNTVNKLPEKANQTSDRLRNNGLIIIGAAAGAELLVGMALIWFYFFMKIPPSSKQASISTF